MSGFKPIMFSKIPKGKVPMNGHIDFFQLTDFGSDDSNINITDKTTEANIIQVSKTEIQNKRTTQLSISKSQDQGSGKNINEGNSNI